MRSALLRWPFFLVVSVVAIAMIGLVYRWGSQVGTDDGTQDPAPGRRRFVAAAPPNSELDVVYGKANGEELLLDIFKTSPALAKKPRPAILLLHSGAWRTGSKQEMSAMGVALAKAGFVCFSADYRLVEGQKNRYPAAFDDARLAMRWIRANAAKYSVDGKFIGAAGDSAGGQLSALLGTRENPGTTGLTRAPFSSRAQAVVDLCGMNDLATYVKSTPKWASIVTDFLGGSPQQIPKVFHEATPLSWVSPHNSPFLIVHGGRDDLVPVQQSQILLNALKKAKVPASLTVFPNQGHGIPQGDDFATLIRQMTQFFERNLREK